MSSQSVCWLSDHLSDHCDPVAQASVPLLMSDGVCRAAKVGSGVMGWMRGQAQAHPRATVVVAAAGCVALGLLARRRR